MQTYNTIIYSTIYTHQCGGGLTLINVMVDYPSPPKSRKSPKSRKAPKSRKSPKSINVSGLSLINVRVG